MYYETALDAQEAAHEEYLYDLNCACIAEVVTASIASASPYALPEDHKRTWWNVWGWLQAQPRPELALDEIPY